MLWQQFDKHFSKIDPACLPISPGYIYAEEAKKETWEYNIYAVAMLFNREWIYKHAAIECMTIYLLFLLKEAQGCKLTQ